jgi:phosphoglycolate phosphatase
MSIKGILFDKDGTLIEVNGTWVPLFKSVLPEAFGHSDEEVLTMLQRAGYDIDSDGFKAGSVLAAGTTQQLVKVWWPDLSAEEQKSRVHFINNEIAPKAKKFVKPLMDLAPVFDELHAMGMILGLGTNDSEASGRAHMQHLDVHHYFDVMIGADSVEVPKPSGQMIAMFAERTKLKPSEIAMVGDNSHDMEEARAGGAGLAIAVLSGNAAHGDIAHLADHTLDSVADIPALLKSLR